jgi:transcription termination factor Rho
VREAESAAEPEREAEPERATEDEVVEGVVELLANGSGFVRVNPPDPSDDDVYISAAQVKRCDLVPGDRVSGPRRAPRRSERFASLVRIDAINDRPTSEVADSARFEELPIGFPTERFRLGSEDPTLKAIEWLTPFGRGSRVLITGRAQAGKTESLRRLAAAIGGQDDVQLLLALVGVRPEEIPEWEAEPAAALSLAASADAQAQALERVIDQGRRLAARGAHVVAIVDALDGVPSHLARKALGAARSIRDGGSLTVIASAAAPLGGETTVVALDASLTGAGRFPALDLTQSWTMRPELLVGDAGAEGIARARTEALGT